MDRYEPPSIGQYFRELSFINQTDRWTDIPRISNIYLKREREREREKVNITDIQTDGHSSINLQRSETDMPQIYIKTPEAPSKC